MALRGEEQEKSLKIAPAYCNFQTAMQWVGVETELNRLTATRKQRFRQGEAETTRIYASGYERGGAAEKEQTPEICRGSL